MIERISYQKIYNKQYITVDNCIKLLYTVYIQKRIEIILFLYRKDFLSMKLIINHTSMVPIYEQIVSQIKDKIIHGELIEETLLPSVRTLAKELKVSALTVKKAYDQLEEEGFIITVHGKGSFIACANQVQMLEEKRKEIETEFEQTIRKARSCGMTNQELHDLFELIIEDI